MPTWGSCADRRTHIIRPAADENFLGADDLAVNAPAKVLSSAGRFFTLLIRGAWCPSALLPPGEEMTGKLKKGSASPADPFQFFIRFLCSPVYRQRRDGNISVHDRVQIDGQVCGSPIG